jgi:hypothetical protein
MIPFGFLPFTTELGRLLHEQGIRERDNVEVLFALFYFTVGFVTMEIARGEHGIDTRSERAFRAQLDGLVAPDMLEQAFAMVPLVRGVDLSATFDRALRAMLDGFAPLRRDGTG